MIVYNDQIIFYRWLTREIWEIYCLLETRMQHTDLMWIILTAVEPNQIHYLFLKHPTPKYLKVSFSKELLNYGIMTSNPLPQSILS